MTLQFARPTLFAAILVTSVPHAFAPARADPVIDWNIVALDATAVPPNSILQSRTLAIVHAAVYDAVCAVELGCAPYAVSIKAPTGTSLDPAVAAAAHDALMKLAPAQQKMLDAALAKALAAIPDGAGKIAGLAVGGKAAEQLLAARASDRADAKAPFTPKPGAGLYQLTPPGSLAAILPHWGGVAPFILRDEHKLVFKGAPPLTSPAFARDYNEVKTVGQRNSKVRTADQTAAAIFWTVQTAVPWHAAARAKASAQRLSVVKNAQLFAMLSLATADSQIVAFKEKYARPHWRPITAIRAAGDLRNAALEADPDWVPLLGTPPHPEYPSAHSIFSGAAEAVLQAFFGSDDVDVSITFPPIFGVTRTYKSFSAITAEVGSARVWGGIHFRSAVDDGIEVGREMGKIAAREFPRPLSD
jgi:hypothetical protein